MRLSFLLLKTGRYTSPERIAVLSSRHRRQPMGTSRRPKKKGQYVMKLQSNKIDAKQSFRLSIETKGVCGKVRGAFRVLVEFDRAARRAPVERGEHGSPPREAANDERRYHVTWESSTPLDWQEQGIGMST
jgi:hypothetical protein